MKVSNIFINFLSKKSFKLEILIFKFNVNLLFFKKKKKKLIMTEA